MTINDARMAMHGGYGDGDHVYVGARCVMLDD